jgi:hypothetical protein
VAILFAVVGSASGCTTTAVRPSNQTEFGSSTRQTVSAADLSRDGENEMLLAALRRVRPEFFVTAHGLAPLAVSRDGGPLAALSILETMHVSTIQDVSLEHGAMSVGSRITATGAVAVGDVPLVRMRRGAPR